MLAHVCQGAGVRISFWHQLPITEIMTWNQIWGRKFVGMVVAPCFKARGYINGVHWEPLSPKVGYCLGFFRLLRFVLVCHNEAIHTVYAQRWDYTSHTHIFSPKIQGQHQVCGRLLGRRTGRCGRRVTMCRPIAHVFQLAGVGRDVGGI